jgi:hypothetical protein
MKTYDALTVHTVAALVLEPQIIEFHLSLKLSS